MRRPRTNNEIKKWLQENVKKDDVRDTFYEIYKDLL